MEMIQTTIFLFLLLIFSILSYYKKALNLEGILLANIVGLTIYLIGVQQIQNGLGLFITILLFFVISELSSRYVRTKRNITQHEKRTKVNIIGNVGPAIIFLLMGNIIGFFGGIATALADTLSSEIGLFSKKNPRLITNLKEKVSPGTDGGITSLGILASFLGATIIGTYYIILFGINLATIKIGLSILIAGILGTMIDSYIGATLELKGKIGNTTTNFVATLSGVIIAIILTTLL